MNPDVETLELQRLYKNRTRYPIAVKAYVIQTYFLFLNRLLAEVGKRGKDLVFSLSPLTPSGFASRSWGKPPRPRWLTFSL